MVAIKALPGLFEYAHQGLFQELIQRTFNNISSLFLIRTVVIPSFVPHVKSDSPDSGLKSESFIVAAHSRANNQSKFPQIGYFNDAST